MPISDLLQQFPSFQEYVKEVKERRESNMKDLSGETDAVKMYRLQGAIQELNWVIDKLDEPDYSHEDDGSPET